MIRLAAIDNLSGAAFRLCQPEGDFRLSFESPARVATQVLTGACDAALLPVAAYPRLSDIVMPAGPFGIACTGRVHSVQLFTELPLESLVYKRLPVYVTPETRTSVQLLRELWMAQFGDVPNLTTIDAQAPARLLIGDAAIKHARALPRPRGIDLGHWWFQQTGLPFVFARWVVSRNLDSGTRSKVIAWLESCATASTTPEGMQALVQSRSASHADTAFFERYYQGIRVGLGGQDMAGLKLFLQRMESEHYANVAPVA